MSPKQKTTIGGNNFTLELPEDVTLSGTIQFSKKIEREEELRMMYNIDGGGIFSVIDDLFDDNYDHIYVKSTGYPIN